MTQSWWTCRIRELLSKGLFCLLIPFTTVIYANPVILVMGDSLSAEYGLPKGSGWVKLLELQLEQKASPWTVFNASISGETTSGGLARLPALLQAKKPEIVLLELGANDALRGLSIEQTQNNLQKMIVMSKQSGAKVLVLGMQIPPNYGQQYTKQFKELYSKIATQERVELLPFFLTGVAANKEFFQADNIHPNLAAQSILFKNVWGAMVPYQKILQLSQ